MRTYNTDTIVKDVRTAIDENTENGAFIDDGGKTIDTDTLEMEDIIKSKITDGINAVRMTAPLHVLEMTTANPVVRWTDSAKCIGTVELPADFMRLGLFMMSDWEHGLAKAISPDDADYSRQYSEFKGVRGNPVHPVVAISANGGKGVLEFFSCDSTKATATLQYVRSETESAAQYLIEERIYRAVVLKTAALVMACYANADMMQLLDKMSLNQFIMHNS